MSSTWAWLGLALLGAWHGVNPAMGWLFAVARGMHERRRGAVLQALVPIALGHEASLAAVALAGSLAGLVVPAGAVRVAAAVALILWGVWRFARPRAHPRWVGFRVRLPELALWSFLMSTAHGAGLMLLPILLGRPAPPAHAHALELLQAGPAGTSPAAAALALTVHTLAMLAAMAAIALVVYERLGLAVLRRAWVNVDAVWAAALVVTGVLTLFS